MDHSEEFVVRVVLGNGVVVHLGIIKSRMAAARSIVKAFLTPRKRAVSELIVEQFYIDVTEEMPTGNLTIPESEYVKWERMYPELTL